MLQPAYKITLGSQAIDSAEPSSIGTLVSISSAVSMNPSAGAVTIILGLVSRQAVWIGDSATVELGYGDERVKVFHGTVGNITAGIETVVLTAYTPEMALLQARLNRVYEEQIAGAIVSDLADEAGISTQTVEDGINFPFYFIDDRQSCYEHLHRIAEKCGFDLYLNRDNKLFFKKFRTSSPRHTLHYAKNIMFLKRFEAEADFGDVVVRGESSSSSQGVDTSHWLTKSFDSFKGSTGNTIPLLSSSP